MPFSLSPSVELWLILKDLAQKSNLTVFQIGISMSLLCELSGFLHTSSFKAHNTLNYNDFYTFVFPLDWMLLDSSDHILCLPGSPTPGTWWTLKIPVPWTNQEHYGVLMVGLVAGDCLYNLVESIHYLPVLGTDEREIYKVSPCPQRGHNLMS